MTENETLRYAKRDIEENLKEIRERIARAAVQSGRGPGEIRLMAVTKTVAPPLIDHALSLGIDLIGENKVQELLGKLPYLSPPDVEKHLIGHLQSNKVKKIVGVVACIQSVDSFALAEEISKQALKAETPMRVLLEVNIGGEQSKTGFPVDSLIEEGLRISELPCVTVGGLMAIPPVCETPDLARPYFAEARTLFEKLRGQLPQKEACDTLSLGMSADYEAAILEGANLVRVGSALFGLRRY